MTKRTLNRFSPEVRQRAVRMVLDHGGDHASQWSAIGLIAAKIGCTAETLRKWVRQGERDQGLRTGSTTAEQERIVGWRVSRTAHAAFVLDALEQALHDRRPARGGLTHHSDKGSQYVSIRYTERLLEAGIEPSVGSAGDSYDNALAETVIGLFKTKVIRRRGPWRNLEAVEFATLEWVDWYNNRRLLEPIGNVPPAEAEARYHVQIEAPALAA